MPIKTFVLMNVEPQKTQEALEGLKNLENVKVYPVTGRYDFVLTTEVEDVKKLSELVCTKLRNITGVVKTESLIKSPMD